MNKMHFGTLTLVFRSDVRLGGNKLINENHQIYNGFLYCIWLRNKMQLTI